MKYIILNNAKQATHEFKDGVGAKTWDEVKDFDNIAMIVPDGFVVMDYDTTSDAEIMLKIVEGLDIPCRVMKTTRGVHVWFKAREEYITKNGKQEKAPVKNFIKQRLAIGLYSDRKAGGRNAYVKIKDGGKMREWIKRVAYADCAVVPKWLSVVSAPSDKFKFKGMSEGSGRNQELYNYVVYLQSKGFSRDEIIETIHVINDYVFAEPLDDSEIETICRDEAFKSDEELAQQATERLEGFKHNEFGDELIEAYHIINVHEQLYVYEDGYYQQDEKIIEKKMIELFPAIKERQRNEVLKYIRIQSYQRSDAIKIEPYIINLKNTRLDIRTGKCLPFTPDAIEFARIPVVYDPSAYCPEVEKTLNRVFLGDKEVIALFEEMVGACLVKKTMYGKAFILYGNGSNGKSTVLGMLKNFIGNQNYAAIPLEKLGEKFALAELENKLANLGDDIDNAIIKNSGTVKRIFDGNDVQVERKGERPFKLAPYATHVFSANAVPHSYDKSDGFYRRWCIIPFNAKFEPNSPDYDPMLIDKVTTDEAASYLLNIGLRGIQRLLKAGSFTKPEVISNMLEQYRIENSTVLSWVEDNNLTDDLNYFLDTPDREIYLAYTDWCKNNGVTKPSSARAFYRDIINYFDFDENRRQRNGGKRYFVMKI